MRVIGNGGGGAGAVVVAAVVGLGGVGVGSTSEVLAQADALCDRWAGGFEFAAYADRLRGAIALGEEALASDKLGGELRAEVFRASVELAEAYLPEGERRAACARGETLALQALRLDPALVRAEGERGFRAALGAAGDVGAIFRYGKNLGRLLAYDYGRALVGGTRDVLAAFTRAVELDEGHWGGGPHRPLADFLAQTPGFLGGDAARAVELHPAFLQTYLDWAGFGAARDGGSSAGFSGPPWPRGRIPLWSAAGPSTTASPSAGRGSS